MTVDAARHAKLVGTAQKAERDTRRLEYLKLFEQVLGLEEYRVPAIESPSPEASAGPDPGSPATMVARACTSSSRSATCANSRSGGKRAGVPGNSTADATDRPP